MRMKQNVMTAVYNNNNRVKCKLANWAVLHSVIEEISLKYQVKEKRQPNNHNPVAAA